MGGSSSRIEEENARLRHLEQLERRRTAELQAQLTRLQRTEDERIRRERESEARKQRELEEKRRLDLLRKIEEQNETRRLQQLPKAVEVKRLHNIFWDVISTNRIASHWINNRSDFRNIVSYIDIHFRAEEVQPIVQLFKVGNSGAFIDKIERVENPLLLAAYLLKKKELENRFKYPMKEEILFHGTTEKNAYEICKNNFDWRHHGFNNRQQYGKGVSFTTSASFASHYSEKSNTKKIMIAARVLVGQIYEECVVDVVPNGYDTVLLNDGKVIVKFDENEFYPAYVITYHPRTDVKQGNKIGRNKFGK